MERVLARERKRRLIRRKIAGIVNLLIDIAEIKGMSKPMGILAHAFNEIVLYGDPKLFLRNLIKYELSERGKRRG